METLARPIFLLTDFGTEGAYAGQVRAVIAAIAPGSTIHDLSHDVAPFAVDEGAWVLETSLRYLPAAAVVLAVVDPGVGTERKGILVQADGRTFVGPDNGILSAAFPAGIRGGVPTVDEVEVHELTNPRFRNAAVSATFHARDIFAPAAAWLSLGTDYRRFGPPLAGATTLPPFCGQPVGRGRLEGYVVHVDRYGNLVTTIRASQLFPAFRLAVGERVVDRRVRTFADAPPGVCFCHADSSGFVAIAMREGSAADALGVRRGAVVAVEAG